MEKSLTSEETVEEQPQEAVSNEDSSAKTITTEQLADMKATPHSPAERHALVEEAKLAIFNNLGNLVTGEILYILTDLLKAISEQSNIPLIDSLSHIYLGGEELPAPNSTLAEFVEEKFKGYPVYDEEKNTLMIIRDNDIVFSIVVDSTTPTINLDDISDEISIEFLSLAKEFIEETGEILEKLRRTELKVIVRDIPSTEEAGIELNDVYERLSAAETSLEIAETNAIHASEELLAAQAVVDTFENNESQEDLDGDTAALPTDLTDEDSAKKEVFDSPETQS